jgi:hypothetical protein
MSRVVESNGKNLKWIDSLPSGDHDDDDDSNFTKIENEENPSQIEAKRVETDDYL